MAGGRWPEVARRSAVALVAESSDRAPSVGVMLLRDLRLIFREANAEKIGTEDLLDSLNEMDESPWGDIRGKELDARALSRRLNKYGVKPKNLRVGGRILKGYEAADLHDAWSRYLPPADSATTATTLQNDPDRSAVADVAALSSGGKRPCLDCGEPMAHDDGTGVHMTCKVPA